MIRILIAVIFFGWMGVELHSFVTDAKESYSAYVDGTTKLDVQ